MMQDNGSVSKNVKYRNLCKEQITVHVAYIHQGEWFEIENNSMVDVYKKYQLLHGGWSIGHPALFLRRSSVISTRKIVATKLLKFWSDSDLPQYLCKN